MSDQQIIKFLSEGQNTCGRIEPWQISSVNRQLAYRPRRVPFWKSAAATIALCLAVALANGQTRPKVKQTAKKELVITPIRAKRDSMTVYHPAVKLALPALRSPVIKTEVTCDLASKLSGVLGGLQMSVGVVDLNHKPIGYFRTFEDLLQVITH